MSVFKRWNGTTWEIIGPNISSTRFDNINNMIAQEFDPKSTYNIDDYIIKNDKLYKCIKEIKVPQSWNLSNWQEITLGQHITEIQNNIITVSDIQPINENNKIWVKPNDENMEIPLTEDVMMLPDKSNYGKRGQYPQSTGTGIEWVDYGMPSQIDVEEAINSWLNAHPEATTTVQDNSLTTIKYKEKSITNDKINDLTITGEKISNLTIDNTKIKNNSITNDKIQNNTIESIKFSNDLKLKTIKDYVTPEMFGAAGDGITNDAAAIQTAFDSGKAIYFSDKTYLINDIVIIKNDISFFGDGPNSILKITGKITTDTNPHLIRINNLQIFVNKTSGNAIEIIANNNDLAQHTVNIESVYFKFNNSITSNATMLYLYGLRESMISNCVFYGSHFNYSNSTAIKAYADSSHFTMNINITGCNFYYVGNAIYFDGAYENHIYLAGFRISDNTIIGCGYGIKANYVDTLTINNNMIDYCTFPIFSQGSTNMTISDNYIQTAVGEACILIKNGSMGTSNDVIIIKSNVIHSSNSDTSGSETVDGIKMIGYQSPNIIRHVQITGNFIYRVKTAINLANTQFTTINENQVFYAKDFIDGNQNSQYTRLINNYVQIDVPRFFINKTDTWKIHQNQWGSRYTNGIIQGKKFYEVDPHSSQTYEISFSGKGYIFFDTPAVNVTFTDVGTSWEGMFLAVTSVTTSGFTLKVVNSSDTKHANTVNWQAILC